MTHHRALRYFAMAACVALPESNTRADALARLEPERLRATQQAVEALVAQRQTVARESGFRDTRAILHCHSLLSHDSRSPLEQVIAGAKAAGVEVVMFTEHPAPHYDFFSDGHRGLHDGVLVIPGAETEGFLAYPRRSIAGEKTDGPQALSDLVRRDGGLAFVCHLEERMDWAIQGVTGTEIYNTHADFKDETRLLFALRNPAQMARLGALGKEYPQAVFAALFDYPADYLRRYDELCLTARHTGVAGNDSHHNQQYTGRLSEDGKKVVVLDMDTDRIGEILLEKSPEMAEASSGKKPGDTVFAVDLDPYPQSLHHTSTHLLLKSFDEAGVWDALEAGRAYVAFDWIADPTGFCYEAVVGEERFPSGSEIAWRDGMKLQVAAPLPAEVRLIRNGKEVARAEGREVEFPMTEPGNYRVELWLTLAGEPRVWVLSNPVYVRAR